MPGRNDGAFHPHSSNHDFLPKIWEPQSNDSNASAPWDSGPAHDFHAPANCIVPATFNPEQRA